MYEPATQLTERTISLDGKVVLRTTSDPDGNTGMESMLHNENEHETWKVDTKEAIAATIFEFDPGDDTSWERPSEDICHMLAEHIRDTIVDDPYEVAIDGVETFILALACEGVDVGQPAFAAALETMLSAAADEFA